MDHWDQQDVLRFSGRARPRPAPPNPFGNRRCYHLVERTRDDSTRWQNFFAKFAGSRLEISCRFRKALPRSSLRSLSVGARRAVTQLGNPLVKEATFRFLFGQFERTAIRGDGLRCVTLTTQ